MKSIMKRSLALVLALVLAACTFTGCGASYDISKYADEVVATYGDQEIYLYEANFYARLQQYYSEAVYSVYYGTNFWTLEVDKGLTLEDTTKESVMASVLQTYVLLDKAAEYKVSLNDEDLAKVEEAVKDFYKKNTQTLKDAINLSEERLTEILKRNALAIKVYNAVVADVDTVVKDEDARQVTVEYLCIKVDDKKTAENAKKEALAIVDRLEKGEKLDDIAKELKLTKATYSATANDKKATDLAGLVAPMKTGEVKMGFVDSVGAYAMKCTTDFDKEKTEAKKEEIIKERESALFQKTYTEWNKSLKAFEVVDKIWDKVVFDGVPMYIESELKKETEKETQKATESETKAK